jgi:hypothetical protein
MSSCATEHNSGYNYNFFFGNKRERPRQWHNKGASSTRAQAAGPPPIPRVPRARTNKQGS